MLFFTLTFYHFITLKSRKNESVYKNFIFRPFISLKKALARAVICEICIDFGDEIHYFFT